MLQLFMIYFGTHCSVACLVDARKEGGGVGVEFEAHTKRVEREYLPIPFIVPADCTEVRVA